MQRCRDALMQVVGLPGVDALALAVGSSWGKRKWRSLVNHWINYSNLDKYIVNLINMFWLIIVFSFILSFQICCGLMDFWGFDCLILGHLQVLFVLCRWRTTDTKSSHRTNTTGLTRSGPSRSQCTFFGTVNVGRRSTICHVMSCEDPCWKGPGTPKTYMKFVSWNSLNGQLVKLPNWPFGTTRWRQNGGGMCEPMHKEEVRACHM